MDYRDRKEHEQRLRRIVLHSADVAPDRVAAYIRKVAGSNSHQAQREVFKEFVPLVVYLAKDYVDFCIDFLIAKPEDRSLFDSWQGWGSRISDYHALGIEEHHEFYPPSPLRGPFLRLLRENEDEGLRLIQTIANRAAQNWRARKQHQRRDDPKVKLTPLPVVINLPSGAREFWGDWDVYRWFRPIADGPHTVMSALMALELWMEEQIKAGRDADALFEKVLADSECVAVLGVCVSIALAFPRECLRAVLPVVSSPAVWDMDIRRFTGDLGGSFGGDPFGRHAYIYKLQAERDKLPQRHMEVRHLSPYYLFVADESLRTEFEQAVARFTDNLPFSYEEEREVPEVVDWIKNQMQLYQSYDDPANYRFTQTEQGVEVHLEQPQHLFEQNKEELTALAARNLWLRLNNWAHNIIKEGKPPDGLTVEQAIDAAKQLQQPEDFKSPYTTDGGNVENWRLQAIAGVAAASLIADFHWVEKHERLEWCRRVLLAAGRMPYGEHLLDSREGGLPFDPKVSAALGLGALVEYSVADAEVRDDLLGLISDTHQNVVAAVFRGLQNAWQVDEVLCWNALSLALSLCLQPRDIEVPFHSAKRSRAEARWARKLAQTHLRNLRKNHTPPIPRLQKSREILFVWGLAEQVIGGLPLTVLSQEVTSRVQMLRLTDDLINWTIAEQKPERSEHSRRRERPLHLWDWNRFLTGWMSRLASLLTLEETQRHILNPIKDSWHDVPKLTADLMQHYIFNKVGTANVPTAKAQAEWREMCSWVLDDLQHKTSRRRHDSDVEDALSLIVFVSHNLALVEEGKSHINLFTDVIDRWVHVVGGEPHAYSSLLSMLSEAGRIFIPEPALTWLERSIGSVSDRQTLFEEHKNGIRTAELLQRIWNDAEERIRQDTATLRRFSELIDYLVPLGIPLASILQQKLEQRS
jgi:hypothetical protein